MKLADFGELRGAELSRVEWIRAGNRETFVVSDSAPGADAAPGLRLRLRASFLRALALDAFVDYRVSQKGVAGCRGLYRGRWAGWGGDEGARPWIDLLLLSRSAAAAGCAGAEPVSGRLDTGAGARGRRDRGAVRGISGRGDREGRGAAYRRCNPFCCSADALIPVVALAMQGCWIPNDADPFGRFARWYLWLHIAMGRGLMLLAVAGFSGLVKMDSK